MRYQFIDDHRDEFPVRPSPLPVDDFNISLFSICLVIKPRNFAIECFDHRVAHNMGRIDIRNNYKIIAADMSDEITGRPMFGHYIHNDFSQKTDGFVAMAVSIVVVKGLEIINIKIEKCEDALAFQPALKLIFNRGIPG